ncbi:MAG: hypothetical protein HUJ74_00500 [Lachnospiraceae bacterium]|nr:hypothetical protein [Lachnospiraceae bacterium]
MAWTEIFVECLYNVSALQRSRVQSDSQSGESIIRNHVKDDANKQTGFKRAKTVFEKVLVMGAAFIMTVRTQRFNEIHE